MTSLVGRRGPDGGASPANLGPADYRIVTARQPAPGPALVRSLFVRQRT
jgi:hypothetical protein